jgi:tetratricopeptide (TPR) repeat protein
MYKLSEIDQLLIERKLDNTLTDSELITFNQRLTDADFAAEVKRFEKSVVAIKAFGDNKLKALLQEEEAKLGGEKVLKQIGNQPKFVSKRPPRAKAPSMVSVVNRWAIAAILILGIGGATMYFIRQREAENKESIYASKFRPYRNYAQPTVRENAQKNDIEKAFSLYDNGAFEEALVYFEKIKNAPFDVQFFQANAYLATNQKEKAEAILKRLSENSSEEWQQKAEWYLALSLSEKQADKAQLLFEKIKNTPNHPYQKQAIDVLNK